MPAGEAESFSWRFFDFGDWRLALTSPRRRPASIGPAGKIARSFQSLPPEPLYARGARGIDGAAPGEPPAGGLAVFDEACSLAGGVLVTASGEIVAESLAGAGQAGCCGPVRREGDGGVTARVWPLTPMPRLAGDTIYLRETGDGDYRHWLIDLLPRIAVAAQFCDLSRFKIAVSRSSAAMASIIRDSLGLFGINPEQIVAIGARPTFFQRLVYPLPVANGACAKSPRAIEVLEFLPARFPSAPAAPKRVYIGSQRPDDATILEALRPLGFTALDPAGMSFAEQVRAFSQAEAIVGDCGPGLANAVFATRGVRVLALTAPGGDEDFFADLIDLKQGRFGSLRSGASLDRAAFERVLDDFTR